MDHHAVARSMYDRDATASEFGIELLEVGPTRAVTRMQVVATMCNGLAVIHGGMTFLLADSAMAFASSCENDAAFATSAEIDWIAPATVGQWLTAVAERRAGGGRSAVWDVTVTASDEPDGAPAVVALFRGRTRKVGRPVVE